MICARELFCLSSSFLFFAYPSSRSFMAAAGALLSAAGFLKPNTKLLKKSTATERATSSMDDGVWWCSRCFLAPPVPPVGAIASSEAHHVDNVDVDDTIEFTTRCNWCYAGDAQYMCITCGEPMCFEHARLLRPGVWRCMRCILQPPPQPHNALPMVAGKSRDISGTATEHQRNCYRPDCLQPSF